VDSNGDMLAIKAAPDGDGLIEVLSAACQLFFWAADPFAAAVNRPDIAAQIKQELAKFGTLPGAFAAIRPTVPLSAGEAVSQHARDAGMHHRCRDRLPTWAEGWAPQIAALRRSKRNASRSRSGRSLSRFGKSVS
jgi:hypothetical protein